MGKPVAIVAALLLLLTYLLIQSRTSDQIARARTQQSLQAIQLHDAELNQDVLMARAGLLANYDSLAQTGRNLFLDMETIRIQSRILTKRSGGRIGQEVVALSTALDRKLKMVEYLKADNALLRNSLAYFVQSVETLRKHGSMSRTAMEIDVLSHSMLSFVQAPEPGARGEAEAALAKLSNTATLPNDLEPLTVHGRLIVELLPRVDRELGEIIASPTGRSAEALQRAVLDYAGGAEARAQRFRVLLYLVALILLGYLLHQYTRLRTKARELRWKEMQLIQANKMTALGTLVSGVAHEINNPNQVILMNAGVIAGAWDDAVGILDSHHQEVTEFSLAGLPYLEMRDTLSELVRQVGDGSRRIERILSDLRDFARPGTKTNETFQLNDVVDHALRLLSYVIRKRTDCFQVRLAERLPCLRGNSQHVEQVVVNLVMNALEALPRRDRSVVVTTRFKPQQRVVSLDVRDEGIGIPREHISRLGEPFFTTKEASGGTGLGLAITSSLIQSHKARISFSSEPGKGTCATVTFPCAADGRN